MKNWRNGSMIKRLNNHKYAQCHVEYNNYGISLWSYSTEVIMVRYDNFKIVMTCSGLYSMTTRRHISWFLEEYFPSISYYDIKKAVQGNYSLMFGRGVC